MKKLLFSFIALFFVASLALAQAKKDTKKADESTVTVSVDGEDVVLKVDGDYSWKTLVEDAGLKYKTPEWNAAKKLCRAVNQAWANYKSLRAEGKYAEAELAVPRSDVRGWMALRQGREAIGKWSEEDSMYHYNTASEEDSLTTADEFVEKAEAYSKTAKEHKITGSGDNSVENLDAQIVKFKEAITAVRKYQTDQAVKAEKKAKKKAKVEGETNQTVE